MVEGEADARRTAPRRRSTLARGISDSEQVVARCVVATGPETGRVPSDNMSYKASSASAVAVSRVSFVQPEMAWTEVGDCCVVFASPSVW